MKYTLTNTFNNSNPSERLSENNTVPSMETDNETENRFGTSESAVPLPLSQTGAQQAGGSVRDVLPQPVDSESPSAVDYNINKPKTTLPTTSRSRNPHTQPPQVPSTHTSPILILSKAPANTSHYSGVIYSNCLEERISRLSTSETPSQKQFPCGAHRRGEGEREVTPPPSPQ